MKLTVEVRSDGSYTYQCDEPFPPALVAMALRQIADRIDTRGGSPPARSPATSIWEQVESKLIPTRRPRGQ
jgi:hypothetical protein